MSKTKEELDALKEEVEALNEKICELTPEELEQVNGGCMTPEEAALLKESQKTLRHIVWAN